LYLGLKIRKHTFYSDKKQELGKPMKLPFVKTIKLISLSGCTTLLLILTSSLFLTEPVKAQDCGSKNGIAIPCWDDFKESDEGNESLPFYPYAKRANGCSIPGGRPGEYDNFGSLGYNFSFREPCNNHDRCYYTLGTDANDCNTRYRAELFQVCHNGASQPLKPQDFLTGGTSRAAAINNCLTRADFMSQAVFAAQQKYHPEAQNTQADYLRAVNNYIANQSSPRPRPPEEETVSSQFLITNNWHGGCLGSIGNSRQIDNPVVMTLGGACEQSNAEWEIRGGQIINVWHGGCLASIGNSRQIDNPVVMTLGGACGQSNAQWQINRGR
jgi:hypothetical protein